MSYTDSLTRSKNSFDKFPHKLYKEIIKRAKLRNKFRKSRSYVEIFVCDTKYLWIVKTLMKTIMLTTKFFFWKTVKSML